MITEELIKSKNLRLALISVGFLLVIFISFASGVAVGFRKARFSYEWGKNYERNFMGIGRGSEKMQNSDRPGTMIGTLASSMMGGSGGMMAIPKRIEGRDFRNAHGLAGTIISIAENNLIIKDRDGKENTVAITKKTIIKDHMIDVDLADLKIDDQIVVMGKPDEEGVVKADLVRVFCCAGATE